MEASATAPESGVVGGGGGVVLERARVDSDPVTVSSTYSMNSSTISESGSDTETAAAAAASPASGAGGPLVPTPESSPPPPPALPPRVPAAGVPAAPKARGRSGNRRPLPLDAVNVLKAWLLSPEHVAHPYPTVQEQAVLMRRTGIGKRELTQWFTNARRRIWRPLVAKRGKDLFSAASPRGGTPGGPPRCAPPLLCGGAGPPRCPLPPRCPPPPCVAPGARPRVDYGADARVPIAVVTFAPPRAQRPCAMMNHPAYGSIPVYEAEPWQGAAAPPRAPPPRDRDAPVGSPGDALMLLAAARNMARQEDTVAPAF